MQLPESIAVEWLAAGGIVVVLGYLVRFRQWTFLLAGHDGQSAVPEDVIAEMAGNTLLRTGLAVFGLGIVFTFRTPPQLLVYLVEAAIAVAVIRMLYKLNTYSPANE